MLTNKQRAFLSSLAAKETAILQIGKSDLTPEIVSACDEALAKRELIKLSVLKNCFTDPHDIAETIAERTHAQVVRVIGKKIILYRAAKKPVIELPKQKTKKQVS